MRKRKLAQRILAVLLSSSMVLGAAPVSLQAADISDDGTEIIEEEAVAEESVEESIAEEEVVNEVLEEETIDETTEEIVVQAEEFSMDEAGESLEEAEDVEVLSDEALAYSEGDGSGYVTVSVEVYDKSNRNYNYDGRYLVAPTRIPMTENTHIRDILAVAVGGWDNLRINSDNYDEVTGVRDDTRTEDGFLDKGDLGSASRYKWGFLRNGIASYNGGDQSIQSAAAPGDVVRIIYGYDSPSYYSNEWASNGWCANKDSLIKIMATMNEKQKATVEYAQVQAVALDGDATQDKVTEALNILNSIPENPLTISEKSAELRMGESVTLTTDCYVSWRIEDESIASLVSKNDQMDGTSYCTIIGRMPGTTTVYATSEDGQEVSCDVTVVAPVYFEYTDGTTQEMKDGAFTLTAMDEGRFVLNQPKDGETAIFECEDKLSVWNANDNEWNYTYHWWVDDKTGTWQPAAAKLEKTVTVSTANFTTTFAINYVQTTGITDLKAYIDGKEVSMDKPYEITGTTWNQNNYYDGIEVIVKGMKDGKEITIPTQALSYNTDDTLYNFRFLENKMIINRAGEHTMTISLKQQSGLTEGAESVSFKVICKRVPVTGMYVNVDDANNNVCYIDAWDAVTNNYVGVRPGSWDGATGEMLNNGYHITFTPANTTDRDVKWEVLEVQLINVNDKLKKY